MNSNVANYINNLDANQKNILKAKMTYEKALSNLNFLSTENNDDNNDDDSNSFTSLSGIYDNFDEILSQSLNKDNKNIDLEKTFLNIDKNNDGQVDQSEFSTYFTENNNSDLLQTNTNSNLFPDYSNII